MSQKNGRGEAHNGNGRDNDAERYKEAATEALEMVDWCIGYLTAARKEAIAAQLAKNRSHIRKQLGEPAEPVPTTDE